VRLLHGAGERTAVSGCLYLAVLVGIAIGSEWSTGTSMMAELWPDRSRGKGAGMMQCGLGIGFFIASFIWLFVGQMALIGTDGSVFT
jgi:MFS family permease